MLIRKKTRKKYLVCKSKHKDVISFVLQMKKIYVKDFFFMVFSFLCVFLLRVILSLSSVVPFPYKVLCCFVRFDEFNGFY